MSQEATNNAVTLMTTLHGQGVFKNWVAIDEPWQPDHALLQLFGSLPDINGKFNTTARRQVRCSPQLREFIFTHTSYRKMKTDDLNPELALQCLLESCFVSQQRMFKNGHSPHKLISLSHMCIDMAFCRAVLLASAWLGPEVMPAGYIATSTWPPPEDDAGL